jgi:hypothetical protein
MNSSEVKNEINETSSPMPPRNFIRTTTTETGLQVTATTVEGDYPTGLKIAPSVKWIGSPSDPTMSVHRGTTPSAHAVRQNAKLFPDSC